MERPNSSLFIAAFLYGFVIAASAYAVYYWVWKPIVLPYCRNRCRRNNNTNNTMNSSNGVENACCYEHLSEEKKKELDARRESAVKRYLSMYSLVRRVCSIFHTLNSIHASLYDALMPFFLCLKRYWNSIT